MDEHSSTQTGAPSSPAGYYAWSPADKNYTVYLNVAIIDRLNFDVMRGYGAVPKRGAEVGGLLLGSVEEGDELIVRVDEFVTVASEHLRGPSYILSDNDLRAFDAEMARWTTTTGPRVVGYFRSNTREMMQLGDEDRELLDTRLPAASAVCLLIKPYTTRPCEATFLLREDGAFPRGSRFQTFTFRRKELGGGAPTPRRERGQPAPRRERETPVEAAPPLFAQPEPDPVAPAIVNQAPPPEPATTHTVADAMERTQAEASHEEEHKEETREQRAVERLADLPVSVDEALKAGRRRRIERLRRTTNGDTASTVDALSPEESTDADVKQASRRYRWIWLPLSLVFLLLGIVIGAEVTLTFQRSQNLAINGDPYELDLTVSRFGSSFMLKWNPNLPALRQAKRAELYIEEGKATKTRVLSADELAHGSVILTGAKENVRFRLTLFLRDRSTFSETVDADDKTP